LWVGRLEASAQTLCGWWRWTVQPCGTCAVTVEAKDVGTRYAYACHTAASRAAVLHSNEGVFRPIIGSLNRRSCGGVDTNRRVGVNDNENSAADIQPYCGTLVPRLCWFYFCGEDGMYSSCGDRKNRAPVKLPT